MTSYETRRATVHAVGDPGGNIASGAINVFKSQLIGYDILNGTYDNSSQGKKIRLTIDAEANVAAYEALGGRTGLVGVYNYKTGEVLCMVSTPTFDPADRLPDEDDGEGYYFNNFLDGKLTPGSTFKLVTAAAVIDNIDNRDSYTFDCDGENERVRDGLHRCPLTRRSDFRSALRSPATELSANSQERSGQRR